VRIVREEQGAGLGGEWLGELLVENCERGTGSWHGRTLVGGNWWVIILRAEQGAGLGGQWLGGTGW